jgi:hypothetical protein
VSVDADIARRLASQHDIAAEVDQVAYLVEIAVQPRQTDTRRLMTLQRAFADLTEQIACGQDFDRELSVLGACVLEWKESRLAEIARCCCPDPGGGERGPSSHRRPGVPGARRGGFLNGQYRA